MEKDKNDTQNPAEEKLDEAELAEKLGQTVSQNSKHLIHCLTVIGQIEGHYVLAEQNKTTKYEHIIPALVAIEQDRSVEGLLIILNTVGGDVEAGLAIAELISGMKTPTVSLVVGGGHSIGVPLAVSAKRSFIVPTASMTIHPVRMNGTVLGVPQTLSYFDKMQDRIINFVLGNSNIKEDDFRRLMMNTEELVLDVGSVLEGEKAVEIGLIDELGGLSNAMECLYDLNENTETKKESQKKTRSKSVSDTKSSANPKADNQQKQSQKTKSKQTSAPKNEQNQFWSIILFAVGILVALMTVIKGTSGWLGIHNLLLGTFGAAVFFVPVILIYTSIQIGMEKSQRSVSGRAVWGIAMTFLASAALQIFFVGEIPGNSFIKYFSSLYNNGVNLKGGGVASLLIAGPLLKIFGSIGAKIITVVMFFVFGMLLSGLGLIDFLKLLTKPFRFL